MGKKKLSRLSTRLVIRDTKKYGKGVFAGENIKKGTVVHIMSGKRMDVTELVRKVNSGKENINDPFQMGKRTYIDLDKISRTFNHSCDPNTGIRKTNEMIALKEIKKGEELTYDYSLTIAPTEWRMECKCGSRNCRKILGDILSIPKDQLDYYKKAGVMQRYIKLLMKEIESNKYSVPKYEILALEKLKK